jgi:hypothetical protein
MFTILCAFGGAIGQPSHSKADSSAFVLVPGAKNVRHYELSGGRQQLSYHIDAEYPAQGIIERIRRDLDKQGWKPTRKDYFNPELPNSIARGWEYYEDQTTQPNSSVRYWQVDWRRKQEIVTYRLEYRCPGNQCASTRDLHDLQIIAVRAADADKTYR